MVKSKQKSIVTYTNPVGFDEQAEREVFKRMSTAAEREQFYKRLNIRNAAAKEIISSGETLECYIQKLVKKPGTFLEVWPGNIYRLVLLSRIQNQTVIVFSRKTWIDYLSIIYNLPGFQRVIPRIPRYFD